MLKLLERALGLALLKIPTAIRAVVGIAHSIRVIRMSMNALEPCSDFYFLVNVLRQSSAKVCIVRAFFVRLMCCKVCRQLDSSILIQTSLGGQAGCQYASHASRRREAGVCKEGQVSHCCWQGIVRLRRRIPFLIFVTKPISFFCIFLSLYSVDFPPILW